MEANKRILEIVRETNEIIAKVKEQLREQGENALQDAAEDVFKKSPGLKKFVVWGYTPGFNDGEPCTHNGCYGWGNLRWREYQGNSGYYLSGDDASDVSECSEFLEIDEVCDEEYPDVPVYANTGAQPAEDLDADLDVLSDLCQMIYDTNYMAFFTLTEDGVNVDVEEYDCGY